MHKVPLPGGYWTARFKIGHYQDGTGSYQFYCWEFRDQELRELVESLGGWIETPSTTFEANVETKGYAVFNDPHTAVVFKLKHL